MKNLWYAIPPYKKSEGWRIVDENGELVAIFESGRDDCLETVELHNKKENEKL